MKVFYFFYTVLLHRTFAQVTEVYTTVDPRENAGLIVNGGYARPGERKEIVSIQYEGKHICGGVIVANKWILSAAHCLQSIIGPKYYLFNKRNHGRDAKGYLSTIKIIIGEFNRLVPVERSNSKFAVTPKRIVLHPRLRPDRISSANKARLGSRPTYYHDLMLINVPDLYKVLDYKQKMNDKLC